DGAELDHHKGDREYDSGQGHHSGRDGREKGLCGADRNVEREGSQERMLQPWQRQPAGHTEDDVTQRNEPETHGLRPSACEFFSGAHIQYHSAMTKSAAVAPTCPVRRLACILRNNMRKVGRGITALPSEKPI